MAATDSLHGSDSENAFDSWDDEDHRDGDLRPRSVALGLNRDYVRHWKPNDAFREFYQNWKDGIVTSFQLDFRTFRPTLENSSAFINITVHRPAKAEDGTTNRELLGFIKFSKKTGSLELTNFHAKLTLRDLSLGGTTKTGDRQTAGMHGEGFKLAALVMRRNEHSVRLSATSFYWNFTFRNDRFYCRLTEPKAQTLTKSKAALSEERKLGPRRSLISYISEDVSVKVCKGRGPFGSRITEEEFRGWMNSTIDLCGPPDEQIIRVDQGDLILDVSFAGKVYLKGLYVSDNSPCGVPYRYGYNFATGYINRDRERLTDQNEEATNLAAIWEAAMDKGGDDVIRRYRELFDDEHCPDVMLVERCLSQHAAIVLWKYMRCASPATFFYPKESSESVDQEAIITRHLGMSAEAVPSRLWKAIARHGLLHTPQVERKRRFERSKPVAEPKDMFGSHVLRFLKACLSLDSGVLPFAITIVEGAETDIDAVYSDQGATGELLIASKWFDFQRAHTDSPCELTLVEQSNTSDADQFSCDHVVEDLFHLVCNELPKAIAPTLTSQMAARGRLRQTPRGIVAKVSSRRNKIVVRWTGNESSIVTRQHGSSMFYAVTLHKASTCHAFSETLINSGSEHTSNECCEFPQQLVCRTISEATFKVKEPGSYFPMVSRHGMVSFFGTPPDPVVIMPLPTTSPSYSPVRPSWRGSEGHRVVTPQATSPSYSPASPSWRGPESPDVGTPLPTTFGQVPFSFRPAIQDLPKHAGHGGYENPRYSLASPDVLRLSTQKDGDELFYSPASPSRYTYENHDSEESPLFSPTGLYLSRNRSPSFVAPNQIQDDTITMTTPRKSSPPYVVDQKKYWEAWGEWHSEVLPKIASDTFYTPTATHTRCKTAISGSDYASLVCERLGCTFQRGLYFRLQITPMGAPEYIALIHQIHEGGEGDMESTHLVVTLYTPVTAEPLFRQTLRPGATLSDFPSTELVLHCSTPECMGSLLDTHIIEVDQIASGHELPRDTTRVVYCIEPPIDKPGSFFCRYARTSGNSTITFMPLAPYLVGGYERRMVDGFTNTNPTYVIDFTPDILGPLEGFVSAISSKPYAAIGFDESRHITWRVRYPECKVFDGTTEDVFRDIPLSQLRPPSDHPTIALVSGKDIEFAIDPAHSQAPDLQAFLQPLRIIDSVVASELEPDFTVAQLSPAFLHDRALGHLGQSVLECLKQGQVVRVKLASQSEIGIPITGQTLIVVASHFPALVSAEWGPFVPSAQGSPAGQQAPRTIRDYIGDLAVENPRVSHTVSDGFVCALQGIRGGPLDSALVYNHHTGQHSPGDDGIEVDMDAESVPVLSHDLYNLKNPVRGDRLTVREIARLKGLKDDIVFYGSEYSTVLSARPPAESCAIARMIERILQRSRKRKLDIAGLGECPPNKRPVARSS